MSLQQRREAAAPAPDDESTDPSEGLLAEAGHLTRELRELMHEQLELVVLESRLALRTVIRMLAFAVGVAVLMTSAWLTLVGTAVVTLLAQGWSPALAMVAATAVNLGGALVLLLVLRRQGRFLGWPATLRTLKPGATGTDRSR